MCLMSHMVLKDDWGSGGVGVQVRLRASTRISSHTTAWDVLFQVPLILSLQERGCEGPPAQANLIVCALCK